MDTITAPLIRDLSNRVAFSARRFSPEGDGVDVALRRQIALLPRGGLVEPAVLDGRRRMPTTRQHPCRAAPWRSPRSRFPLDKGSAAEARSTSTGACRAAESTEKTRCGRDPRRPPRDRAHAAGGRRPDRYISSRSGRWPWRTRRWWPSAVFKSACLPRKSTTSASTAWANRARVLVTQDFGRFR